MITDALMQLSTAQAVTASAGSTNTIYLGPQPPGARDPLFAVVTVGESVAAAGAATVAFEVISSAAADLSSPTVLASSGPIPKADLAAGRAPIIVKAGFTNMPSSHRYLGMRYTVGTGPLTAGKFTAALTDHGVSVGVHHASGFTVA